MANKRTKEVVPVERATLIEILIPALIKRSSGEPAVVRAKLRAKLQALDTTELYYVTEIVRMREEEEAELARENKSEKSLPPDRDNGRGS